MQSNSFNTVFVVPSDPEIRLLKAENFGIWEYPGKTDTMEHF